VETHLLGWDAGETRIDRLDVHVGALAALGGVERRVGENVAKGLLMIYRIGFCQLGGFPRGIAGCRIAW
jgi:hypothetical protein